MLAKSRLPPKIGNPILHPVATFPNVLPYWASTPVVSATLGFSTTNEDALSGPLAIAVAVLTKLANEFNVAPLASNMLVSISSRTSSLKFPRKLEIKLFQLFSTTFLPSLVKSIISSVFNTVSISFLLIALFIFFTCSSVNVSIKFSFIFVLFDTSNLLLFSFLFVCSY